MAVVYTITRSENLVNNSDKNQENPNSKLNNNQKSTLYDQWDLAESSRKENFKSSSVQPELYHVKTEKNTIESANQRSSSVPYESLNQLKPEVYYISLRQDKTSEYNQQSKMSNNIIDETKIHSNSPSDRKVTAYMIASLKDDEFSETSSLPAIHPRKKKHTVSFNVAHDNDRYVPNEYPIGPQDVSPNIHYELLSSSKASESIRRSMNKYRFGDN